MKKSFPTKLHLLRLKRSSLPAVAGLLAVGAVSGCVGYYPDYADSQPQPYYSSGGGGGYYSGDSYDRYYGNTPYYYGPTTIYYERYSPGYYYRPGYGYYPPRPPPRGGHDHDDHHDHDDRPRGWSGTNNDRREYRDSVNGANRGDNPSRRNDDRRPPLNQPLPPRTSGDSPWAGRNSRGPIPSISSNSGTNSGRPSAPLAVSPRPEQRPNPPPESRQDRARGWSNNTRDRDRGRDR